MKHKILAIPSILLLTIALFLASCAKKGDTGPAGPAGPQGPAGPTGNTGATGVAGTANVIYSPWMDVRFTLPNPQDSSTWQAQINAPKLVDSILNKGDIKVYFNFGSDSTNSDLVLALPLDGNLIGVIAEPYFQPQQITILSSADISSFTDNGNHYFQFRYILIPGGTTTLPISVNGNKKAINWNDYNQVKAYLGLKD